MRLLVTIHGIRTFGAWQRRLENLISTSDLNINVHHFRFGYFSFLAFYVPLLRRLVVRRFSRELEALIFRLRPDRIDLVAHSFGTYVAAWALRRSRLEVKIDTLILCGSVLRPSFYWADLI